MTFVYVPNYQPYELIRSVVRDVLAGEATSGRGDPFDLKGNLLGLLNYGIGRIRTSIPFSPSRSFRSRDVSVSPK